MKNAWIGETSMMNNEFIEGKIKAVVLKFQGLGAGVRLNNLSYDELELASSGILVVMPYYGPWSWMNRQAREFVDDLTAAVYREFELGESVPLACMGGSMGGASSLLYARYGRRQPVACEALYPVCDFFAHFKERPDLPATMRSAALGYPGTFEEFLTEQSPLLQAASMPDIPYFISHGDNDKAVSKTLHSDRFVAAMRKLGRNVRYNEIHGMGHGASIPLGLVNAQCDFLREHLL